MKNGRMTCNRQNASGDLPSFDSKCARVYVSESNELTFVPYGFDIINNLGTLTDEVKRRFQELARTAAPKSDALQPLIDDTTIGKSLAALAADSRESDFTEKAVWQAADDVILTQKEATLAHLRANSPQKLREALSAQKRRLEAIREELKSVAEAISDETVSTIKNKVVDLIKYEQAVATSAKLAFGDLDVPGVGSEVWRELLIAASEYSTQKAYPGQPYPATVDGVKCVLCLQPLDESAKDRLAQFLAIHPRRYFYETRRSAGKRSATSGFVGQAPESHAETY